jgi:uncharacterized protein (DUF433 family)
MTPKSFVNSNPDLLGGTTVFAGTRVPVRILFEYLESGEPLTEFLDEFPSVTIEMAQGVLHQAKQSVVDAHPA